MPINIIRKKPKVYYHRQTPSSIEEVISLASAKWGSEYRRKSPKEAAGPCPLVCGGGNDRFVLFQDGGYWCRQCGSTGWVTEEDKPLTESELLERRVVALERKQHEIDERLTALERIARCANDVESYYASLDESAIDWWHEVQGVNYDKIHDYKLGFCHSCPTAPGQKSYTIPYMENGKLINIRHRLQNSNSGKYRPHMAGLGIALFNADTLREKHERIVVVEGEIKSIVLTQTGFPAVGMMGKRGFDKAWTDRFTHCAEIIIALDPDATDAAWSLAHTFRTQGWERPLRVARMPGKPDDLIVKYGATAADMRGFLELARAA